MRIKSLHLQNFKRFTDLKIENISEKAKLVLLIGANGSGKSSVFDAFYIFSGTVHGSYNHQEYFAKNNEQSKIAYETFTTQQTNYSSNNAGILVSTREPYPKFYGRPSVRIVPRISQNVKSGVGVHDGDRPATFIDADIRFSNDVLQYMQNIDNALREPVFSGRSADTFQIFQDYIKPLNDSLVKIFSGDGSTIIQLVEYENFAPERNGRLLFEKGNSKISYDLLSHGEKQVVILLLNFIVRKQLYENAIIFIDEMDAHLNTSLQQALLHEIVTKWIPDSAQLWTASHALGFIDYARKSEESAIIDFDGLDFDIPQTLLPMPKDNLDIYEIAIPKETIASILANKKLVVAENKNAALYNLCLGEMSYLFLPANNSSEVILVAKEDSTKLGLRDRDYLTDDEIALIKSALPNLRILRYYAFENYLWHPDNIESLAPADFDKPAYTAAITAQKNDLLLSIAVKIAPARQHYSDLKMLERKDRDSSPDLIARALKSNDFETFYPFFDMKKYFDKSLFSDLPFASKELVRTKWFREHMLAVLE